MHTRQDYISNKVTHSEYYAQFVDPYIKHAVLEYVGRHKIMSSKDESFNDIPLNTWDCIFNYGGYGSHIIKLLLACGDCPSPAGMVCIAKEAARQIKGEG